MTVVDGPPRDQPAVAVADVVGGYLDAYAKRRRAHGRVFDADEPAALFALALSRLGGAMEGAKPRAVAAEYARIDTADLTDPTALDIARVAGNDVARPEPLPADASQTARGWRACALTTAGDDASDLVQGLLRKASSWPSRRPAALYGWSRLAFHLGLLGERAAGAAMIEELAALRGPGGVLPHDEGAEFAPASAAHLAQFLAAALACDRRDVWEESVGALLGLWEPEQRLLRRESGATRWELSPWVLLGLGTDAAAANAAAAVLVPSVAPTPGAELVSATATTDGLEFVVRTPSGEHVRRFDRGDLGALADAALRRLEQDTDPPRSARQHAHAAIALEAFHAVATDAATRDRVEAIWSRSIDAILDRQAEHGGWPYAYGSVSSVVYEASGRRETTFPDHAYTIDAAVPGIALVRRFRVTSDERLRAAAVRALSFYETAIGRVERHGASIWRLFPDDDKTAANGTAVNYELWNAWFFAELASVCPESSDRLAGYVDDAMRYALTHLRPSGDIAYGDYVDEARTAYAAWDALLFARIAEATDRDDARDAAERIVARLADVLEPSGLMPNVAEPVEWVGAIELPRVHRHGIGPWPVRTYYQLYLTIAAALVGRDEAGLPALAHVLLHHYDPVFGQLAAGRDGRGQPGDQAGFSSADWVVWALGSVVVRISTSPGAVTDLRERLRRRSDGAATPARCETPSARELRALWARRFDRRGRGYADESRAGRMPADEQAEHALAFLDGSARFGDPQLAEAGRSALAHMLRTTTQADGGFSRFPGDPHSDPEVTARVRGVLAAVLDDHVERLEGAR